MPGATPNSPHISTYFILTTILCGAIMPILQMRNLKFLLKLLARARAVIQAQSDSEVGTLNHYEPDSFVLSFQQSVVPGKTLTTHLPRKKRPGYVRKGAGLCRHLPGTGAGGRGSDHLSLPLGLNFFICNISWNMKPTDVLL